MIPEELMVGDWALWKGKPVQVASVSGVKYSFGRIDVTLAHCNEEKFLETHDIKSIQPIPLTPEILYKNGFPKNEPFWHFDEDKHYRLELTISGTQVWWTIGDNQYRLLRLQYVHELQHALRLCGIEKEIVL